MGLYMVVTLSLVLLLGQALCQNGTVSSDQTSVISTVEEAMKPFYEMTNTYLDVVHPKDRVWILDDPAFSNVNEIDYNLIFTEWKASVKNYIGFLVCIAVGLLFVLVMPIAGLVLCCCRCCCGNCGANAEDEPEKEDRWVRYVCGVLLLIFTTFILAGTILTFFTNEYLWEQTAHEDRGALYETNNTFKNFESYKLQSKAEFKKLGDEINTEVDNTVTKVKRLPEAVAEAFDNTINVTTVLQAAKDLQISSIKIKNDLQMVDTALINLKNLGSTLASRLQDVGGRMSSTLQGCPSAASTQCSSLRNKVNSLKQLANFSQISSINLYLDKLQQIELSKIYTQGKEEYDKLRQRIDASIKTQVNKIETTGQDIKKDINTIVTKVLREVDQIKLGNYSKYLDVAQADVQKYGNYRKYGGIAVGCALLITAVLFYLGLLLGCCGSDPDSDTACNKATGANLLMGGIVWAFLFSWILMLVVIVLFLSGGLVYTEGCRHIVHLGSTPESQRALNTLNSLVKRYVSSGNDFNITAIVMDCKENKGAYTAFNLQKFIDIDAELNLEKYGLQTKLSDLEKLHITIPAIDIISDENEQQLRDLQSANLQSINFQSFYGQLDINVTNENLESLAAEADNVANLIRQGGDGTKANQLQNEAQELRIMHTNIVLPMMTDRDNLKTAVTSLEREVKGPQGNKVFDDYVASLLRAFDELQAAIDLKRADNTALSQQLVAEGRRIYADIENFVQNSIKKKVKDDVAKCGSLYQSIDNLITKTYCGNVVQPYNAFWFSVGWCLFFFIPCIIVAWTLNVQYRRIGDYEPAEKGFEDPNYDAYAGTVPGDTIPLEDYYGHRKQRAGWQHSGQQDHENMGNYFYPPTSGTPPPYPTHYYDNRHY